MSSGKTKASNANSNTVGASASGEESKTQEGQGNEGQFVNQGLFTMLLFM